MATIKAIEGRSVHQIQSGQVIVDLCSVVKELVENSLDAGATSIDVRFKNNGLDSIEVQDNGQGIAPDDYETIALKHYTSKLSTYDDLSSLTTFGFRGEALSSLCALSRFHILTARASDGPKGTRLDFETSGKLKGTTVVASQKGTTVAVENLFYNLPVRRRELEKNIKREYGKVLGLLHAYACISVGVRFAVSNQAAKGKKVAVFSTKANPTTRENIANVYGTKTLLALIPLDLKLEMTPTTLPSQSAKNWSAQEDIESREVRIQGHISRPVVGEGRQTPDRQMFFVNSRPCGLPQVSKAVNEVYKSYNVTQSPFIFANLVMDTSAYDVNVSPDKRTIMLHDQAALLEALKEALIRLFEEHDQSVPQAQLGTKKLSQFKPLNFARQSSSAREDDNGTPPAPGNNEEGEVDGPSSNSTTQEQESTPISLIQKFAGRDVIGRSQLPQVPARKKSDDVEKPKLALSVHSGDTEEPADPTEDDYGMQVDTSSPPQSHAIPRPVQDFNDRFSSVREKAAHQQEEQNGSPEPVIEQRQEPSITAVMSSSQKSSPGPVQNAFDRMRPKRTPAETATITIGNKTTTMTIGTPEAKRRRIHTPKYDLKGGTLRSPGKTSGFVSALRMFAAPGTQVEDEDEEEEGEEEMDEIEDEQSSAGEEREQSNGQRESSGDAAGSDAPDLEEGTSEKDDESVGGEDASEKESDKATSERGNDDADADEEMDVDRLPRAESPLFVQQDEESDEEYLDEDEKKAREEDRVAQMIAKAEEHAARPTKDNMKRATNILKGSIRKSSTLQLIHTLHTSASQIGQTLSRIDEQLQACAKQSQDSGLSSTNADQTPEERLSLTVSKTDFGRMRIIGQFNLGFILAVRPATNRDAESTLSRTPTSGPSAISHSDDLFIIDQHASDEKINFERLANTTILAPQRLVHPHPLDLTAIEEEIILSHPSAFAANGFQLTTDTSGDAPVGKRCRLLGLPVSKETTFTVSDLEELVALLNESSLSPEKGNSIPRPGKVRRMLAMRACRSSIMIGKTLTKRQMKGVVEKMGEIDKPWNCPHGRPTMRHLASLDEWEGWREGDGIVGLREERKKTEWGAFMKGSRKGGI